MCMCIYIYIYIYLFIHYLFNVFYLIDVYNRTSIRHQENRKTFTCKKILRYIHPLSYCKIISSYKLWNNVTRNDNFICLSCLISLINSGLLQSVSPLRDQNGNYENIFSAGPNSSNFQKLRRIVSAVNSVRWGMIFEQK